jgi:formiminoglutamase
MATTEQLPSRSEPWARRGLPLPADFERPAVNLRATATHDPRIGHLMGDDVGPSQWPHVAFIGFQCDEGVRRNNGREGAAIAPDAIREALYRMTPDRDPAFTKLLARATDFGNLRLKGDLGESQALLGKVIAACLAHDTIVIVIGGGHETTFGHFLGYAQANRTIRILNWDAHPDVRHLIHGHGHSGSPFRQAIEHPSKCCARYDVAGLLPHAVAASHVEFVTEHGGHVWWRQELIRDTVETVSDAAHGPSMVSFDMDALDQAYAPGVSAPAVGGLTPDLWLHAAYCAGLNPKVSSIDIVEMNPRLDRDGQTARIGALTLWTFLKGVAARDARA